jgi:hypothetical protein
VRRYRIRDEARNEFEIIDVRITRRKFRVRRGKKLGFRVIRVSRSDELTREHLAKTVVRMGLAVLALSWMYALATGSHDDMRELRQSLMMMVTFVLVFYFGKHGSK